MTREQAIKRLESIVIRDALQEDYDALEMAIQALESIDKIKAEIEEAKEIMNDLENDSYYAIKMNDLRDIIDKHSGTQIREGETK